MNEDKLLRDHVIELMKGGHAHATFAHAVAKMPAAAQGKTAPGLPHSPWQVLEHLRVAQRDILDFCIEPNYKAPAWPDDYWPKSPEPPHTKAWGESVKACQADLKAMCDLVRAPATKLYDKIPWGDGQTVLREALLVADHNAYHTGQLVTLRRVLGAWSE